MIIESHNHHPGCNFRKGFDCDCLVNICKNLSARLEKFENFFKRLDIHYISHDKYCISSWTSIECNCSLSLWIDLKKELEK